MGTDGSWPASRSARSHPGRATLAWTATRRSASVRGGFRRRRRSRRTRAFCDRAPPGRRARTRLGLWACLLGGETPRAGVETRTEEDHLRGGESRERGEDGVVEESGADGDASLVAVPRARTRARVSSPASAAAKGSTKSGGGSSRSDSSARSAAMDLAESVTARGVPSTIETTSRRDAREGVARRARGPTRARRTKPPASERRRDDAREARCARTRTKTHEADARDAKKILVVRYVPGEKSSSGYLETNLVRFSRRATRYDEPFPPSTPRSGTRIRAVDPAP